MLTTRARLDDNRSLIRLLSRLHPDKVAGLANNVSDAYHYLRNTIFYNELCKRLQLQTV
jgi:hypothetical protein